jgi:hypothetical protein
VLAHQPYGSAFKATVRSTEELFDTGYDVVRTWVRSRTNEQLPNVVDREVLGLPVAALDDESLRSIA